MKRALALAVVLVALPGCPGPDVAAEVHRRSLDAAREGSAMLVVDESGAMREVMLGQ